MKTPSVVTIVLFIVFALAALAPAVRAQSESAKSSPGKTGPVDKRLEQLEQQMVDLQVAIGTLQSLAREQSAAPMAQGTPQPPEAYGSPAGSGFASGGAPDGGELSQRISVLETQIQALTAQMEQMSQQLMTLGSGGGSGQPAGAPGDQPPYDPSAPLPPPPPDMPDDRRGEMEPTNAIPKAANSRFGTTTVTHYPDGSVANAGIPRAQTDRTPGADPSRTVYDQAYRHLLAREYGDAETGFRSYLEAYPSGPLAANAQYWLGETHYVRGQYKSAADQFLKGYRNYRSAEKAPDNLLKLGMSLHQLGQKDAACATLGELAQNFPNAPSHIRDRAKQEQRRVGC